MIDETQDIEIVDVEVAEEAPDADVEQTIEVVEVAEGEEIVIESEEAFPPLGVPNEQLRHTLLTELDVENQHPIEAIIGLRTALDTINSLKSVYSDIAGVADYYQWVDGKERIAVGYFVSLTKDKIQIYGEGKINNPSDKKERIFGVTVDEAGFIGHENFEEVAQHDGVTRKVRIKHKDDYALVATSGFVEVRCEVDVDVGDFVISNEYGKAQKSETEYGYKVVATETKHNVRYAIIALNVSADITEEIGRRLQGLDKDIEDIKANIISMMATLGKTTDEVDELKENMGELQELGTQVNNAALTAEQAKAIAASAIASAEAWRKEAVEEANKAFAEATKVREEFEEETKDMKFNLENTSLELQEAKEDLWREQGNMQASLNDVSDKFESMRYDLIPLYSWSSKDGTKSSISGFVAQANEDSATLGGLVEWKGEGGDSLAGFVSEATKKNATVKALADYAYTDKTGKEHKAVAALDMYAKENEAAIKAIAGFDGNLAGIQAKVDANSAAVTTLASHVIGDYVSVEKWDEAKANTKEIYYAKTGDAVTYYYHNGTEWKTVTDWTQIPTINPSLVYYVKGTKLYYYYKDDAWQSTEKPYEAGLDGTLAGIHETADANSAKISMITDLDGEFVSSLAGIISLSEEDRAEIDALAQYGYVDENGRKHCGAAGIMAEVDKNKASIEAIAGLNGDVAGFKAQVDKNTSYATMLAEKVMGDCITIPLTSDNATKDILTIYYDDSTRLYWYYSSGRWNSTSDWNTLANAALNIGSIYYVIGSRLYWYYKDGAWLNTESPNEAGLSGTLAGMQVETNEISAQIKQLTSWQGETKSSLALIKQQSDANGASIRLLAADIDKYSVGECSQAYGFTLGQANDVLGAGMVYVPTVSHTETYKNSSGDEIAYSFTEGNLYTWTDNVSLDLNGDDTSDIVTAMWSESVGKVAFWGTAPAGYEFWYKNSTDASDGYEGNTLYKFEKYVDEGVTLEHWTAVASLYGNSSNRAVSQIRQDANSIISEVTNAYGAVAGFGAKLADTNAKVNSIASWPTDGGKHNLAVLESKADANGSYMVLAAVTDVDGEPTTTELSGARIVLGDSNRGSYISMDADQIMFEGAVSVKGKVEDIESKTVYNTQVEYALSSSATEFIALTEWSVVAPGWRANAYMWQRTLTTRGDGSSFTSNPTCIQGAKGADGTGVTIKGVAYTTVTIDDTIIGNPYNLYSNEGCTAQITTAIDGDSYLVKGYLFVYSGSGSTFTCAGKIQGPSGDPGTGVSAVVNYYMASSRSSGVIAGDLGETADEQWTTTVQAMTANKPYLWNYETIVYTDSRSASTTPAVIGRYGSDGRGIAQISEYYCVNSSTSCPTPTAATLNSATVFSGTAVSGKWYTTSPPTNQALRYLWNCERIIYTDGTPEIFAPANIGTHGIKGDNGISINSTTVTYGVSTSASVKPTVWYPYIPDVVAGQYLWTCTTTDYTDTTLQDTVSYTYAKQGEDGRTPIKGIDYKDGTSVTVSSIKYQVGTSATIAPTGYWNPSVVEAPAGQYLWTQTTFSDGTVAYGVAKQGESGPQGSPGPQIISEHKEFYLSTSNISCVGGSWGASPSGFTKGRYMWTKTVYILDNGSTVEGVPVLDNTYTTISGWCSANNTTLIDGANIATGTITANQIAANSITADKLAVGALTADSIRVTSSGGNTIFYASASDPNNVRAGGFYIDTNSLYSYSTFANSGLILSSTGTNGSFSVNGSTSKSGWKILAGMQGSSAKNFGVDSNGYLYAFGADIGGRINATSGYIGGTTGWTINSNSIYCGSASTFFTNPDNLYSPYYQSGLGVQICASALGTGDGAIGGVSIGCCPVPATEAYDATYHQQFIYGMYHMFRTRMSRQCYALNINSQGIYFKSQSDSDISTTNVLFTNYIGNLPNSVKLFGTWETSAAITVSSARILKTDIDSLDDKHSVLFDNLVPRQFKYNDGESGRTHYGLVVDELKSAMDIAGITPAECAAYCLTNPNDPDGDGGIRYSELIALCIKEIQALKQKVKELEKEKTNE